MKKSPAGKLLPGILPAALPAAFLAYMIMAVPPSNTAAIAVFSILAGWLAFQAGFPLLLKYRIIAAAAFTLATVSSALAGFDIINTAMVAVLALMAAFLVK